MSKHTQGLKSALSKGMQDSVRIYSKWIYLFFWEWRMLFSQIVRSTQVIKHGQLTRWWFSTRPIPRERVKCTSSRWLWAWRSGSQQAVTQSWRCFRPTRMQRRAKQCTLPKLLHSKMSVPIYPCVCWWILSKQPCRSLYIYPWILQMCVIKYLCTAVRELSLAKVEVTADP